MTTKNKILFLMNPGIKRNIIWSQNNFDVARQLDLELIVPEEKFNLEDSIYRELLADAQGIVTSWGSPVIDNKLLSYCNKLSIIGHAAGSVVQTITPQVFRNGIHVVSANFEMSRSVAEWSLMMTLIGRKRLFEYSQIGDCSDIDWEKRYLTKGLYDCTIGIWGYGDTVRHLLPMLRLLEPREIIISSDFLSQMEAGCQKVRKVSFDEIFSQSDVIHLLESLTPETCGSVSLSQLSMIKDNAVLCNCARAHLIDYHALIEEISKKRFISILDVYHDEPLRAKNDFSDLPNVILTPHNAGYGREKLYIPYVLRQIGKFFRGERFDHEINEERYYAMTNQSLS